MEEEFNAWYDSEHLPERLAIPGFRSARRWSADCAPAEGKYRATYELDSPAVLQSPAYIARYSGATPWTQRCLGLARAVLLVASEAQTRPADIAHALQTRRFIASGDQPARLPTPGRGLLMRLYRAYAA